MLIHDWSIFLCSSVEAVMCVYLFAVTTSWFVLSFNTCSGHDVATLDRSFAMEITSAEDRPDLRPTASSSARSTYNPYECHWEQLNRAAFYPIDH